MADELTYQYLSECFDLNEGTGTLTWKTRPTEHFKCRQACGSWNTKFAGKVAGYVKARPKQPDYVYLKLSDRHILAHRVVWAISRRVDLSQVPQFLDHANGFPLDNRPQNLRAATVRQNLYNRAQNTNKYGHKGVRFNREAGNWSAVIDTPEKKVRLGTFGTKEEAAAAWVGAAKLLHGEFYRETQAAA